MLCPYCNSEMELGIIRGDRYSVKWVSMDKDKGTAIFTPFIKGIKISSAYDDWHKECYYCKNCNKIIINLDKNIEDN